MRKLGIDLGSSSLGWYVGDDGKTVKKGVITFDTGMSKGQSGGYVSPTKERREARSKRNLIRARKYRKWELLKTLMDKYVPLTKDELEAWSKYQKGQTRKFPEDKLFIRWLSCDFTYQEGGVKYKNPYELRVKALDHKLSNHEIGRALYHIIQRRGYKDIGETDTETEKQIARRGESGFQNALNKNRTIAEALTKEFLDKNLRARNQYPYRDEYEQELEKICQAQGFDISKTEKKVYKDAFVRSLWKSIIWQRPLRSQKGNIGKCILEPNKLRCPISHPVFEIFRTWQFINTIRYFDENDQKQPLTKERRNELYEWFLKKDSSFKFEDIRNFLDRKSGKKCRYNYPINEKGIYDTSVSGMPVCNGLIGIFGDDVRQELSSIESFNVGNKEKNGGFGNTKNVVKDKYSVYDLWHAVFNFDEKFLENFAKDKLGIQPITRKRKGKEISISPLVELKQKFLRGYADLSLKAMCKIIPFLKQGYLYNEAVVLAKMPELLGEKWEQYKDKVIETVKDADRIYDRNQIVIGISNSLIEKWKGDKYFADKDYTYKLQNSDILDIEKSCSDNFGEKTWKARQDKDTIIQSVKEKYQEFFADETRAYRKLITLTDTFNELLNKQGINIDPNKLYHHSNVKNRYTQKCKIDTDTEKPKLPTVRDMNGNIVDILPAAIIDSIKNPMFNKAMSILRKLINELIKEHVIDQDTEVVVELARELNDNNKRIAIERYQNDRKNNRLKYRAFLQELIKKENVNIDVENSIPTFELWTEQIFEKTEDENKKPVSNKNRVEILKEKDDIKRYELWMEQKGQCMYTGKMISISDLFSNRIDIMHTIPRSLLPDDTLTNMTVGYARYNRDLQRQKLPTQCDNYDKDVEGWGTCIKLRIEKWETLRNHYKQLYEERLRAKGNEDENAKNKRIQEKHYYKLYYDYWKEKVERFEAEEVTGKWARRQLTDTQMISKYTREFLKSYFKKVAVQKGSTTAVFRKIFDLQAQDEIKDRAMHTHHAVDAFVLTLVPANSSSRDKLIEDYYAATEKGKANVVKFKKSIQEDCSAQQIKQNIENSTLIFNYEKDNVLKQANKKARNRGQIQYLKRKGKYVLKDGEKIMLIAKGDTVRSSLYAQTYLGKIREVERDNVEKELDVKNLDLKINVQGFPKKREGNDWQYKQGEDEFSFVVRKPIKDVLSKIDDIVDPCIKELVRAQKNNTEIKDFQGNIIRHVRIKVKKGREVKERINYRSKHDYKNKFYSESGSVPYALLLQKNVNGKLERKMVPVASCEIAKTYKNYGCFDIEQYIKDQKEYTDWNKTLLKVGQKVFVLKDDKEYEQRENIEFQRNRLYVIKQFKYDGSKIMLQYHLEAQANMIDKTIKSIKDNILKEIEIELKIPLIKEDVNIINKIERKKDFQKRVENFTERLNKIKEKSSSEKADLLKEKINQYKTESSVIEIEGETPILGLSQKNWNFLIEGKDFEMNMDGDIQFLQYNMHRN